MGQKINPNGQRIGINKTWSSRWYVEPRKYADMMHEDLKLRRFLSAHPLTKNADVSDVEIIRHSQQLSIIIHTARPGVIIGTKGATIEKINGLLQKEIGKKIQIKIKELKQPATNAQIIAMNVARQLRTRSAFRRVLKMAISAAMKGGAQGIKIRIAGRLGGSEMSRAITLMEGRVPLHTLRANIDYGFSGSFTAFGTIGVKVWVFTGEVFHNVRKQDAGLLVRKRPERKQSSDKKSNKEWKTREAQPASPAQKRTRSTEAKPTRDRTAKNEEAETHTIKKNSKASPTREAPSKTRYADKPDEDLRAVGTEQRPPNQDTST